MRVDRQLGCFARRATQGLVARMSAAISGIPTTRCPGSRFAHPGYGTDIDLPTGARHWYGSCKHLSFHPPDKNVTMPSSRPDRIRKLLADLVGFDTISDRSNLPLIAHIESYLAALGIKGERFVDETGQKAS